MTEKIDIDRELKEIAKNLLKRPVFRRGPYLIPSSCLVQTISEGVAEMVDAQVAPDIAGSSPASPTTIIERAAYAAIGHIDCRPANASKAAAVIKDFVVAELAAAGFSIQPRQSKEIDIFDPFEAGYSAGARGNHIDTCHFAAGTKKREEWMRAYNIAIATRDVDEHMGGPDDDLEMRVSDLEIAVQELNPGWSPRR